MEQSANNHSCPSCPHRKECLDFMGLARQPVNIDQASFSFVPELLLNRLRAADVYTADPDEHHIEHVYKFCHKWVFDHAAPNKIGLNKEDILSRVRESDTSIKLFFLANMLGWKQSHAGHKFYSGCLTGPTAVSQVKAFASACYTKFGTFDTTSLDQLTGSNIAESDFQSLLLSSEMTAGSWIIDYKLTKSGDVPRKLYLENETRLHPYWLATEQKYYDEILEEHILHPSLNEMSSTVQRHRSSTTQVLGQLKRSPTLAVLIFRTREKVMSEAIQRVLGLRGFRANHFRVGQEAWTSSIKFWINLATALQQYECLKFVNGLPSMLDP